MVYNCVDGFPEEILRIMEDAARFYRDGGCLFDGGVWKFLVFKAE